MALTYTSAAARDSRTRHLKARSFDRGYALLACTSLVGALAMMLAFTGRIQRLALDAPNTTPINLNGVTTAGELEGALATIAATTARQKELARDLFAFIRATRESGRSLPNVGAIAAAQSTRGHDGATGPLFTASELASLKPQLTVRTEADFRRSVVLGGTVLVFGALMVAMLWRLAGRQGDLLLLCAAQILVALGFSLLVSRPDPLRDTLLFERYTVGVALGLAAMAATSIIDFQKAGWLELSYVPLTLALLLSILLLAFGDGPGASSAKVNLGPIQPIEGIRLLLALFLAGYFSRRWELLRQIRTRTLRQRTLPAWLNLPRAEYVMPVAIGVASALFFFFLQKDLGPALFLSCVFLAMYAVARGRVALPIGGLGLLAIGFYLGYRLHLSETLAARVEMWLSPWNNTVRGGAQVAEAMWALATGGVVGTGLGLGDLRYLPAGHTDLVLAELGEELGIVGLLSVAGIYAAIVVRGFRIARNSTSDYGFFLATALTLFLLLPVLMMASGILGLTPLTGVVTPFLSYGGSAMVANFAGLGLLSAIDTRRGTASTPATDSAPFVPPLRWLARTVAVAAAALVLVVIDVQVLGADRIATRGHLTIQADGVRRFQYSQRLLDVARDIERGTVFDRHGLVLATGDAGLANKARADYSSLALSMNSTCLEPIERCYPLGGRAFHLLGNATTKTNWSASNSSYIERDAEDTLRGFDDRARSVRSSASDGASRYAVTRDYGALLPLLRHRYDRTHPDVQALLARSRDERVSIDARLQVRVADALARYASRSRGGHAAAVVIDPDSGELLAVASYPWPVIERQHAAAAPDSLLDRARYGLYPPGSTFKLVTAAAALRRDGGASRRVFTCERLDDKRVGIRLPSGGRPIRDDVKDTHPHGRIDMHDGLVASCNAYFAQLALDVGADTLADTASRLGIDVATDTQPERLRRTLPQAGYGQGDVLATPMEMARVAAVFANGGRVRPARWRLSPGMAADKRQAHTSTDVAAGVNRTDLHKDTNSKDEMLLAPEAAALIGQFMRDAVLEGTGRSLKSHPGRIAGKTGTAEVAGAPSHSWFVGYAPHGPAAKKIAFAVVVENAGYGSSAAVPIAGEITTAAMELAVIK